MSGEHSCCWIPRARRQRRHLWTVPPRPLPQRWPRWKRSKVGMEKTLSTPWVGGRSFQATGTPWKINMEPENDGLEDRFPFYSWVICRFQPLIFQGCTLLPKKNGWNTTNGKLGRWNFPLQNGFRNWDCPFFGSRLRGGWRGWHHPITEMKRQGQGIYRFPWKQSQVRWARIPRRVDFLRQSFHAELLFWGTFLVHKKKINHVVEVNYTSVLGIVDELSEIFHGICWAC